MTRAAVLVLAIAIAVVAPRAAAPEAPPASSPAFISVPVSALERQQLAERVRQEYLFCWNSYRRLAWGHDELRPEAAPHGTGTGRRCS